MAIRAIDSGRTYHYFFEIERRKRDPKSGKWIKKEEDNSYDLMTNDEAMAVSIERGFTDVSFGIRTARVQAEERDKMVEFKSHKGEMVQKVQSGTMDLNLLLNCVKRVDRMLPPVGMCERCGCDHKEAGHLTPDGEYLDFDKLINSKANEKVSGAQRMELVIDHFSDGQRVELANSIRTFDSTGELGEE